MSRFRVNIYIIKSLISCHMYNIIATDMQEAKIKYEKCRWTTDDSLIDVPHIDYGGGDYEIIACYPLDNWS